MISSKDWRYLKYILAHKRFVFQAGLKFRVPIWRLIIHDYSKFFPVEWIAYREFFYGERTQVVKDAFRIAWLHHIHLNKHHWNYWVYVDEGSTPILEMPEIYLREMMADWWGAGRAITGRWRADEWYEENRDKIVLHPKTQAEVERRLDSVKF